MNAPRILHVYQCSLDKTICSTPVAARMECILCGRWMRHLYSEPVNTPEMQDLFNRGVVYNPFKVEPQPWTCVRCGLEFTDLRPVFRADGKCCRECVKAETPPKPLLTEEECEQRGRDYDKRVLEHSDRML